MGRYLNQGNESFEKSVNSEIYIDKTGVIKYTNRVLNTLQGYVCIRRPDEKIRKKDTGKLGFLSETIRWSGNL